MKWIIVIAIVVFLFFQWIYNFFTESKKPSLPSEEERRQYWKERKEKENKRLEADRKKQEEIDLVESNRIWEQNSDLIKKFLEIAERKISILDDYGDESWSILPKQVLECLIKIGERENIEPKIIREWFNRKWSYTSGQEKQFNLIALKLEEIFKNYHLSQKQNPPSRVSELNKLDGQEFEVYLVRLLPLVGFYDVRGTPATGDQGADILAKKDNRLFAIQAKRRNTKVGNKAVQEIAAAINYYSADEGWVITNSTFTASAKALAQKNNIHLVDGKSLDAMVRKAKKKTT